MNRRNFIVAAFAALFAPLAKWLKPAEPESFTWETLKQAAGCPNGWTRHYDPLYAPEIHRAIRERQAVLSAREEDIARNLDGHTYEFVRDKFLSGHWELVEPSVAWRSA